MANFFVGSVSMPVLVRALRKAEVSIPDLVRCLAGIQPQKGRHRILWGTSKSAWLEKCTSATAWQPLHPLDSPSMSLET